MAPGAAHGRDDGGFRCAGRRDDVVLQLACRPASCRPKTRAMRSSASSLPDAASLARTTAAVEKMQRDPRRDPGSRRLDSRSAASRILDGTTASNAGDRVRRLRAPGRSDATRALSQEAILGELAPTVRPSIQEGVTFASSRRPPIRGLGVAGGFQMQIEDRGGVGLAGAPAGRRRRWSSTMRARSPGSRARQLARSGPACRSSSSTSTG